MGRPVIQGALALLLALAFHYIFNGEVNATEQIEVSKQSDEIKALSIESSEFRVARDAKGKSYKGRKGTIQNKKKDNKGGKKSGHAKQKRRISKDKIRSNQKNRMKFKKKGQKNKKQLKRSKKEQRKKKKQITLKKKKDKNKPKRSRNKSGQKKESGRNKKKSRISKRKPIKQEIKKNKLSNWKPKQSCDETVLCQKIKDYIKISNQLRKVKRIMKACDTMDKKAKKSDTEFEATVAALETAIGSSSGRMMYRSRWKRAVENIDEMRCFEEKIGNCSKSAKEKCQKSSVAPCQEEANLTKCETELQGWLTKFGPAKGSCLQASSDCCACITALPDVSKDCLAFDKKSSIAVASKKKCTSGDEQGSFGYCKKLQVQAAEKGPKYAKDNCKPSGGVTTKGPSARLARALQRDSCSAHPTMANCTYTDTDCKKAFTKLWLNTCCCSNPCPETDCQAKPCNGKAQCSPAPVDSCDGYVF